MVGSSIVVLTTHRQTRRQVARALLSAGITVRFVEKDADLETIQGGTPPDLIVLDCDNHGLVAVEQLLQTLSEGRSCPPVVLLSLGANKGPLLSLIRKHDIANLVAKHGAIRAVYPVLDERELLVTCEKVIQRNIFGIDKYIGNWGVVFHSAVITALEQKTPFLEQFERFLTDLDCPTSVIPSMVTVAEELILNAVVHAPHTADGQPKYRDRAPSASLVLEPHEYVTIQYGCDGQRLMLSVTDQFGRLDKSTLNSYISRGFSSNALEVENKPAGAGLGLFLSFRSIHQLVFNIQQSVRTEVIAGWYLRVTKGSEFRQVAKSFNLFWLPPDAVPVAQPAPSATTLTAPER
jgi:anti-sigma regulatory factor (Ser/Thr protein kinase)